jgi:hypothetical protein
MVLHAPTQPAIDLARLPPMIPQGGNAQARLAAPPDWQEGEPVMVEALMARVNGDEALVWRLRGPHHSCRGFVMRTSEPEATLES